ncbi:MAG: hypothetical protein AB7F75_03945 [Planctomycetota bacterium]
MSEHSLKLPSFDLFGLPRSVPVDGAALKSAHLKLARACHPDFNLEDQALAVKISSHVNRSMKSLADRLGALRELSQVASPGTPEPKVDAVFLADMMDSSESPDAARILAAKLEAELASAEQQARQSNWPQALQHMARAGYCRSLSARAMESQP